jgi:hypothetical protein
MTFYQSKVAYYGVAGSGGNLPAVFTSANGAGNIGLAWIVTDDATTTSGITDSQSNTWKRCPGYYSNTGNSEFWICTSLKAGSNTVTAAGLTSYGTGSPVLTIQEMIPPPCPIGSVGLYSFIPDPGGDNFAPQQIETSQYSVNQGPWWACLIAAIKCGPNNSSATARTWSVTVPMVAVYTHLTPYAEPSGTATGCLAMTVIPYPTTGNSIGFSYSPGAPVVNNGETKIIGMLISTVS